MKKRMRKAVAIAATAAMVGSLPAGAVTAQAADDDITIGVSIWSSTDVLGSQSKKIIDKAADALGSRWYSDHQTIETVSGRKSHDRSYGYCQRNHKLYSDKDDSGRYGI